jgi:tetratricopeptide (TPR) repeat protein
LKEIFSYFRESNPSVLANPHILSFIQSLSPVEIRLVEEQLNKVHSLFDAKTPSMELQLFRFLIKNKNENISDGIIEQVTGSKRVTDLKNNLFLKVIEITTLDKYILNNDLFNESDSMNFILKKRLLFCKISIRSLSQGKTEAIKELLDEIIDNAKTFEIYDTLVDALQTKKYFEGIRFGNKDFDRINSDILFYEYCSRSVFNAADKYYQLILNNEFTKSLSKEDAQKHISDSIKEMESDYKKSGSEQINYYLHIMRFALFENQKIYKKAIDECNALLKILKRNKSIYRSERIGFAHTNLSQFQTFLGNYSKALKDARKSQAYYLEESFNSTVSKELEFYINFYKEDYSAANKCLNSLLSHSRIDTGEFRRSKYIYYRACVYFTEREFKEALSLLNESLEIEKDKTRWNVSLRILTIMIFIETNKIDEAFSHLESLRKYVERTGKSDEISQRDILIVKLLREMEKNGFEWNLKNKNAVDLLLQLSEKDSDVSWQYFSSELIPFHGWVNKSIISKR